MKSFWIKLAITVLGYIIKLVKHLIKKGSITEKDSVKLGLLVTELIKNAVEDGKVTEEEWEKIRIAINKALIGGSDGRL